MPSDPNTPNDGPADLKGGGGGDPSQRAVSARLDLLESRLIEIEKRLEMTGAAPAKPEAPKPAPTKSPEAEQARASREEKLAIVRQMITEERSTPVPPSEPTPEPASQPHSKPEPSEASVTERAMLKPTTPVKPVAKTKPVTPTKPVKPERAPITIEQFIGGKAFLVLGALIVVVGAGFFLKLAVNEGWVGKIPPLVRCLAAAAFGFGLLVAGELTVKKLGRFAAVGFRAAGLGVLYATSYAAYGAFELVNATGAFVLLIATCALGVGIALRGRSVMLAVLSLVGGYVAPLISASEDPPAWALPAHLLVLLVVGSVIAVRVPYQRVLATLTWWGTALFGTLWLAVVIDDHPWLVIGFASLVWPLVHWTRLSLPPTTRTHAFWAGMPGAASFSTTVWSVGAMVLASAEIVGLQAWHATGIGFVATLVLSLFVADTWRSLLGKPEGQRGVIGASLLAQTAALLPLTLLLMIEPRWGELLVFVLLGTAAFWVGRRIEAWAMVAYGTVLLVIGTLRVLMVPLDSMVFNADTIYSQGSVVGGWFVSPWMVLMLMTAGAWMTCGWLSSGWMVDSERTGLTIRRSRLVCVTVACVLLPIAFLHERTAEWAMACSWFGLAAGAYAVSWWLRRSIAAVPVAAYLALGTLMTLVLPSLDDPAYANVAPLGGLMLSWWMVMVGVAGAAWIGYGWVRFAMRDRVEGDAAGWLRDLRVLSIVIGCVLLPVMFVHGDSARWAIAMSWFGLAFGAFVVSGFIKVPLASLPVLGYLVLTTLLTLSLPSMGDPSYTNGQPMGVLVLSWWMIMTGVVGVSWLVCGWRCFRPIDAANDEAGPHAWLKDVRSLCLVVGCVVLPVMFLHENATREGVMGGWFGLTLAGFGASRLVRHSWASAPSAVYLGLVTVLWVASFLVPGWMDGRDSVPVFLHPGLIWSFVIAASWGVYAWIARGSAVQTIKDSSVVAWWVGGVMLLISTTLEVARFAGTVTDDPTAQAGSVSIWWAVVAVGLLAGGFARAIAPLRYAGIGLLLVATGKVLTYDLAELSPAVRVGSFIGCGLVLLCVAAWYLRVGAKKLENKDETPIGAEDAPSEDLPG